jgi:hypothetical protein
MSREKNQIIGIDLEDLKDLIRVAIRDEIETCLQDCRFGNEFKDEVLSRNGVAELLKMTPEKVTIGYEKKEIPGTMIGREYRFLKSEVVKSLKKHR